MKYRKVSVSGREPKKPSHSQSGENSYDTCFSTNSPHISCFSVHLKIRRARNQHELEHVQQDLQKGALETKSTSITRLKPASDPLWGTEAAA